MSERERLKDAVIEATRDHIRQHVEDDEPISWHEISVALMELDAALSRPIPAETAPPPDMERGLYWKYLVERRNDHAGKHKKCDYFVLDWMHDKFTIPAMKAYASACEQEFPELARDVRDKIALTLSASERKEKPSIEPRSWPNVKGYKG